MRVSIVAASPAPFPFMTPIYPGGLRSKPPRRKRTKRARQYEHIKRSEVKEGRSEGRAEEIAARAVNKERARSGESKSASRSSVRGRSASSRGGKRSGHAG